MLTYNVTITERLVKTIQVTADDEIEAELKAEEMINSEKIVLTADDFYDRDIFAVCYC